MSSRATQACLSAVASASSRSVALVRLGASNNTTGSGVAQTSAMASLRPVPSRGKKPTKRKRPSPASPLATSDASTALAPGKGVGTLFLYHQSADDQEERKVLAADVHLCELEQKPKDLRYLAHFERMRFLSATQHIDRGRIQLHDLRLPINGWRNRL